MYAYVNMVIDPPFKFHQEMPSFAEVEPWNPSLTKEWIRIITNTYPGMPEGHVSQVFKFRFANRQEELAKNCLFVKVNGWQVATAMLIDNRVRWVGVLPEFRGKGIDVALVSKLLENYENQGMNGTVSAVVDASDTAGLALYKTCGFHDAGPWEL